MEYPIDNLDRGHPGSINGQCAHRLPVAKAIWRSVRGRFTFSRKNEAGGDHYRGAY